MADLSNNKVGVPKLSTSGFSEMRSADASSNGALLKAARQVLSKNLPMVLLGIILYFILYCSVCLFGVIASMFVGGIQFMALASGVANASASIGNVWVNIGLVLAGLAIICFFMFGWFNFFRVLAEDEEARLDALFEGGRKLFSVMVLVLLLFGLYFIFIFVATLLFGILLNSNVGGMIIGFVMIQILPIYFFLRYSMVFFLITDDDGYRAIGAMRRSSEIMDGTKWKLFCLFFRLWLLGLLITLPFGLVINFMPWATMNYELPEQLPLLLSMVTGAVYFFGMFWYVPYYMTVYAKFYEDVK